MNDADGSPTPEPTRPCPAVDALLEPLRRGDAAAFGALVTQLQDRVLNIAYRFVRDRQDAEDVAQEVFVEVHRSLPGFRGEAQLSTWIYSIAVRKSLDTVRRVKRKRRLGQVRRLLRLEEAEPELPAASGSDPLTGLVEAERVRLLEDAVAALKETQRVAITLAKFEGLSYAEIAAAMETTIPAVESLIHRALANLEKNLRRHYADQD